MQIDTKIRVKFETELGDNFDDETSEKDQEEFIEEHILCWCNEHNLERSDVEKVTPESYFEITSLCKGDLRGQFKDDAEMLKKIEELNEDDMKQLASEMTDAYCENGFWIDLKTIFEDRYGKENTS